MTEETRLQVIKSLAFGISPEDIEDCNDGVTCDEIEEIAQTAVDEITEEKEYHAKMEAFEHGNEK